MELRERTESLEVSPDGRANDWKIFAYQCSTYVHAFAFIPTTYFRSPLGSDD